MRASLFLVLLTLAGCVVPTHPRVGREHVVVPKEFSASSGWIDGAPSDCERYLQMYRQGYWDCIRRFMSNIRFAPKDSDRIANGWPSEVSGYKDGFLAAQSDVEFDITQFGQELTTRYLKKVGTGDDR